MTTHMIDRVTVEVYTTPPPHGFTLDEDRLNQTPLTNLPLAWRQIEADARFISIDRGPSPDQLTLTATVGIASIEIVGNLVVPPATPIRITADENRLFTGIVEDTYTTYHKPRHPGDQPPPTTTITATDAVSTIAGTPRYGAVTNSDSWNDMESFADRAHRYLAPTGIPFTTPPRPDMVDWFDDLTNPATPVVELHPAAQHPPFPTLTYSDGGDRPGIYKLTWPTTTVNESHRFLISGIDTEPGTPDGTITIGLWVRTTGGLSAISMSIPGRTPSSADLAPDVFQYVELTTDWLPGDRDPGISLSPQANQTTTSPATLEITGLTITYNAGTSCSRAGIPIQNVVYESTLANHLDAAINSVAGAWWVDAHGTVHAAACRHTHDRPTLSYYDDASPSYVNLDLAYGTSQITNSLTFANHGRKYDDETGTWVADDQKLGPYRDEASIGAYGARAGSIATMVSSKQVLPFPHAVDTLASYYQADASMPRMRPTNIRLYHDPTTDFDQITTVTNLIPNPGFESTIPDSYYLAGRYDFSSQVRTGNARAVDTGSWGLELHGGEDASSFHSETYYLPIPDVSFRAEGRPTYLGVSVRVKSINNAANFPIRASYHVGGTFVEMNHSDEYVVIRNGDGWKTLRYIFEIHGYEGPQQLHVGFTIGTGTSSLPAGFILGVDSFQAVTARSSAAAREAILTYWDGDTPDVTTPHESITYKWQGTPHASPSIRTITQHRPRTIPDVMDGIEIHHQGTQYDMAAAHIAHTITKDHWHTSIDLIERQQ